MKADLVTNVRSVRHRSCVLLYTKPACPGRVKTRLISVPPEGGKRNTAPEGGKKYALSAEQAARLHAAFLGDLSERLAGGRFHLQVAWALEGDEVFPDGLAAGGEHVRAAQIRVEHVRQMGCDLGARLYHGLAAAAERFEAVAAVGSDHPELEPETVEQAFAALAVGADAVFGPVEDGGYYLVALRSGAVRRELFEGIPWSTGEVLAESLARCRRLRLEVALLPSGHDVDVADDLHRLAARLGRAPAGECPRTRGLLSEWGWLEEAT